MTRAFSSVISTLCPRMRVVSSAISAASSGVSTLAFIGPRTVEAGLLGAASLVGMLFGGLIFGAVTDKFGRQKVYIADLACFVVLSALQFFASDPWQLIGLRTLMGVAVGAALAIAGTIA